MKKYLILMLLTGCSFFGSERRTYEGDSNSTNNFNNYNSERDGGQSSKPDAAVPSSTECSNSAMYAHTFLSTYCARCHGNGHAEGGFDAILNVPRLKQLGKIVEGNAGVSSLYTLVERRVMPKTSPFPDNIEIAKFRYWIDECMAQPWEEDISNYVFIDINERLEIIDNDQNSVFNPNIRSDFRYLDFSNLANSGYTRTEVLSYVQMANVLINSLSLATGISNPIAIDAQELIYRFNLNDYGWDAATWETIVELYPYTVQYDNNSPYFKYNETLATAIRANSGSNSAYINADWFLSHASRPPVYYTVLDIPEDINQFALGLGVNIQENIANGEVIRAGFNTSGVASHNRVIERHSQPGNGAFWITYDFTGNLGVQNIFENPDDFVFDGGEGFFHLNNGLWGYFLVNGALIRQDKAPTNIVQDPLTRDGAVEAGLSCMGGCHLSSGTNDYIDELSEFAIYTAASSDIRDSILRLYPGDNISKYYTAMDTKRYTNALRLTGFDSTYPNPILNAVNHHDEVMNINEVAGVLGIKTDKFMAVIDALPGSLPSEILALRIKGTIQRESFDALFPIIVERIGLGIQISNIQN